MLCAAALDPPPPVEGPERMRVAPKVFAAAMLGVLSLVAAACGGARPAAPSAATTEFMNPIMNSGADPWAVYSGGRYYLTVTTGSNVTIWSSPDLTDIAQGQSTVAWTPPAGFTAIWSPELHHIGNRWYIYVAADQHGDNATHRMYVLESDTNNPMVGYTFVGQITSPDNHWAIDGTVLTLDGKLYFIWSGWAQSVSGPQNLYIAPMSSPTQISGQRVLISRPTYLWETSVSPINEGPVTLQHDSRVFIVYSANASWTNKYCLGLLTLTGGNPLQASSWVKSPEPVFQSSGTVYGPGHASFTVSPNGTQDWIVYHAAKYSRAGWTRDVRIQPFTWTKAGLPDFGTPLATSTLLRVPAGQAPYDRLVQGTAGPQTYSFSVSPPTLGIYRLWIRYTNPGLAGNASITVDGQPATTVGLADTKAQTSYQFAVASLTLGTGRSQIAIDTSTLPFASIDGVWISLQPVA